MTSTLETATSADGTPIAFERKGDGPPVLLIGGAFNDRTTVAGLATTLAPDVTAVVYDRRGRGDSGDSDSYSVEREIEDISAVLNHLGGSASVFGHSSGANLALEAAAGGVAIDRLALYEPIYVVEGTRSPPADDLVDRIRALTDEDRRDDAVTLFMTEALDMPSEMVEGMRASEMWGWLTGLAHTLPYDVAVCGPGFVLPAERIRTITAPTLAIGGGLSPEALPAAARAVADTIPGARYITLEGQDHAVLTQPAALRTVLLDFFV